MRFIAINRTETGLGRRGGAFTLIEVLVVISIIGILAALITTGAGYAARTKKISLAKGQLAQFELAIDNYKEKLGHYPPDNTNDASFPPLYYELTGATLNVDRYVPHHGPAILTSVYIPFFTHGLANSATPDAEEKARNFFPTIHPGDHSTITNGAVIAEFLTSPAGLVPSEKNRWRYVSTNPTNNPTSYDLWLEFDLAGRTNIVGNWRTK